MRNISISKDIVPIVKFKTDISKWFKNIQTAGHPLIITQNGKPAGVLLSPSDYDELVYRNTPFDSVGREMAETESGNLYSNKGIKESLGGRKRRGE